MTLFPVGHRETDVRFGRQREGTIISAEGPCYCSSCMCLSLNLFAPFLGVEKDPIL